MKEKILENSAIQNHISILQNIISRMSTNSANCKTWSITIISAIVVLLINQSKINMLYLSYIPLGMFFLLDCFYLGLEKFFRDEYKSFVASLKEEDFDFVQLFDISGPVKLSKKIQLTFSAIFSFSIFPFYVVLALAIFLFSN